MEIPDAVLAAALTVFGGAITFASGQIFLKAVLEPVHELKKEIARIAYSLDYYANQMWGNAPKALEARDEFRKHACRLRELGSLVLMYEAWIPILGLPSRRKVMLASLELIIWSNRPLKPDPQFDRDRTPEIRRLLGINHDDGFLSSDPKHAV